jgi:REP element-mobilizing transposase RayT
MGHPSANRNLADIMRDIKANSSRHMRESGVRFAWQDGYSGISVSPSQVSTVRRYIANQKEHHRTRGFDEELAILLERAGVRFDQ